MLTTLQRVKLSGAFSFVSGRKSRGLVMLLHGWEGSIDSKYVLSSGKHLMDCGFNVFRLNFRDHGGTHSLNEGLFYSTNLEEVNDALQQAARLAPEQPVFLCGFSLGGNFALRIAREWSQSRPTGINFRHIMAISPVLNPSRATDAIDRQPWIDRYFIKKWKRSLEKKQHLFPEQYDFTDILARSKIRQMTDMLLERDSHFNCAEDYFAAYAIRNSLLKEILIPTTIVTSRDDPVIPVDDFDRLTPSPHIRVIIHSRGGHNGFITGLRGRAWYEECMVHTF